MIRKKLKEVEKESHKLQEEKIEKKEQKKIQSLKRKENKGDLVEIDGNYIPGQF